MENLIIHVPSVAPSCMYQFPIQVNVEVSFFPENHSIFDRRQQLKYIFCTAVSY